MHPPEKRVAQVRARVSPPVREPVPPPAAQAPDPPREVHAAPVDRGRGGTVFGRVTWTAEAAIVCGQGPSFGEVDLEQLRRVRDRTGAAVIAVNRALDYIPWADLYFTLDPDQAHRERMKRPWPGVRRVAAVPPDYGTPRARVRAHRAPALRGITYLERVHILGLSEDPRTIASGNSAWGALGLAYLMGASRIVLLGVDGSGRRRWDGTRNGDVEHLPELFAEAVPQLRARGVQVVNGSLRSRVAAFTRATPAAALAWLEGGTELEPVRPPAPRPRPRTDIALVLGGADCVWDDVIALERMLGRQWDGLVIAVNDVGVHWPRRLDHWCTLHPEKLPGWRRERAAHGHNADYITWGQAGRGTDRRVQGWGGGASGLLGVVVARDGLRCSRIVLAGIPMTETPHFPESRVHRQGRAWTSADSHWKRWEEAEARMQGRVKSMSGRTRAMLGAPTPEWIG